MLARIDLADVRVRRWAPVAAVVVAALLAIVVPSKSNELVSGTAANAAAVTTPSTAALASTPTTRTAGVRVDAATAPAPAPPLAAAPTSIAAAPRPTTVTTTGAAPSIGSTGTAAVSGPLRVVRHTWAQRATRRGTPLEAGPVGLLPIAASVGADERVSYVKLEGDAPTLTLAVATDDESANALPEIAELAACPIISADWVPEDGQSFASAPAYDPERCVAGEPAADGASWSFPLSTFPDRGTSAGFALVPLPGGSGTWQVTLSPTP